MLEIRDFPYAEFYGAKSVPDDVCLITRQCLTLEMP